MFWVKLKLTFLHVRASKLDKTSSCSLADQTLNKFSTVLFSCLLIYCYLLSLVYQFVKTWKKDVPMFMRVFFASLNPSP